MNAIYRHLSYKFLLSAVLGVSLLIASSCVKTLDEQLIPLAGKWAKVDDASMTSEYVEFGAGVMTEYEADESKIMHDGTIWNSSESDFKQKSSGRYSIKEGVLIVSDTDRGKISVKGNELFVGAEKYMKISGFSRRVFYVDISSSGTANCYIVSSAGDYKFPAVKGNGAESVGPVSSVDVLWESFGTDVIPQVGDLIQYAEYSDDFVCFSTADNFSKGNAVIAAKDASGTILWSWHIWMTDRPEDQVYNNGAGTMMDRNLGATSATPGDVGALGLLYQWGRKDPFLGSSSISLPTRAGSTISWPSPVESTESTGTIDYAVSNPVTFITYNSDNYDWYYTGSGETDDTRWQSSKTIYDPCPAGYRVPGGGDNGIWSKAFGSSSSFDEDAYDSENKGFNFGSSGAGTKKLSNSVSVCWYPSAGYLSYRVASLYDVGYIGSCWSCSPDGYYACSLSFDSDGYVYPSYYSSYRAYGFSVRCLKE